MNIAVSTLLILILILPGIVLRKFYYSEEFSSQYTSKNLFELILSSFIPSLFIHGISIIIVGFFNYKIEFQILGQLLSSRNYPKEAYENIDLNILNIFVYLIISILISSILGYISKKIIRKNLLDSKFKIFRFQNSWHYIITGEFFNFKRASYDLPKDKIKSIDFTHVDVLVETQEGTIIYDGFLVDYELSNKNDLKYITLKNVQRRYLNASSINEGNNPESLSENDGTINQNNPYYQIPGHILVIPYEKIININFSYYRFIEIDNGIGFELVN
ncbi:hypothetical protein [Tenacibaculum finnmarkense]|uniref:hypothetical protein n=1 Tax=Tenacibaculum TaxID=104267 RepID=UPI000738EBB3|nr:hypothetical protein [Tenacibaculum finnmarkense]ALU74991.1 hypothetical protein AUW17_06825 [Tenacibaculum dicentrarchi]MBE7633882.1 hypothetical protein [Tenacibaculum finnmarkense genomovar ulcerans]MBE7647813.1 hypothetical protein [Tenacibaculum finnmarkense genomovar ulcerans]MBE7697696.1 hypothetical protein [Tenacibaculum finnmarkense genomovar ulcerans]MCD8402928.1 hypothetical protein [Tenacibaculum finnmarkense genomovar finnmarkense]